MLSRGEFISILEAVKDGIDQDDLLQLCNAFTDAQANAALKKDLNLFWSQKVSAIETAEYSFEVRNSDGDVTRQTVMLIPPLIASRTQNKDKVGKHANLGIVANDGKKLMRCFGPSPGGPMQAIKAHPSVMAEIFPSDDYANILSHADPLFLQLPECFSSILPADEFKCCDHCQMIGWKSTIPLVIQCTEPFDSN